MIHLNVIGVPREAMGAETPSDRLPIPLRIAEVRAITAPPVTQPIPGHLCEQCLDAPAVVLVSAPWGGQMGVCDQCQQARVVAALPVLTAREGQQTIWHTIGDPRPSGDLSCHRRDPTPSVVGSVRVGCSCACLRLWELPIDLGRGR